MLFCCSCYLNVSEFLYSYNSVLLENHFYQKAKAFKVIVYCDSFISFPPSLSFLCAFNYLERQTKVYEKEQLLLHVASICWRERSEKKEPTTNAYWKDCEGEQCLLEKVVLKYILRPERNMDWHSWEENFYLKMIVRVVPMTTESWFQKKMWFSWLEWRH